MSGALPEPSSLRGLDNSVQSVLLSLNAASRPISGPRPAFPNFAGVSQSAACSEFFVAGF
jgi:hypothetical protein